MLGWGVSVSGTWRSEVINDLRKQETGILRIL